LAVFTGSIGDPVEDEFSIPSTDSWEFGAYNPILRGSFEGLYARSYGKLE